MEYVSNFKRLKSSLKERRQSDLKPWEGDEEFEPGNVEADLFEQEMNAEFEDRAIKAELDSGFGVRSTQLAIAGPSGATTSSGNPAIASADDDKFYDNIYFDSDDEDDSQEMEGTGPPRSRQVGSKREIVSNDDLMYDPDMDDQDQAWVDNIRRQYQTKKKGANAKSSSTPEQPQQPANNSDAVLNCPACFSVLCLDCQRHEAYKHQYRAMFVMNCTIDYSQKLTYPKPSDKKKRKKGTKNEDKSFGGDNEEELFNPVKCSKCSTQVAVYDSDEIFHFFNVVASHT